MEPLAHNPRPGELTDRHPRVTKERSAAQIEDLYHRVRLNHAAAINDRWDDLRASGEGLWENPERDPFIRYTMTWNMRLMKVAVVLERAIIQLLPNAEQDTVAYVDLNGRMYCYCTVIFKGGDLAWIRFSWPGDRVIHVKQEIVRPTLDGVDGPSYTDT